MSKTKTLTIGLAILLSSLLFANDVKKDYSQIIEEIKKAKTAIESNNKNINTISEDIMNKQNKLSLNQADMSLRVYDDKYIFSVLSTLKINIQKKIAQAKKLTSKQIPFNSYIGDSVYIDKDVLEAEAKEIKSAFSTLENYFVLENKISAVIKHPLLIKGEEQKFSSLLASLLELTENNNLGQGQYMSNNNIGQPLGEDDAHSILVENNTIIYPNVYVESVNKDKKYITITYTDTLK